MNSIKRFILPGNVKYFRSDEDVLIPEEYVEREKEVRGVWFSTVANIDVPKMKDTSEESTEELKKYLHGGTINILDNKKYSFVSYKGLNVGPTNTVNRILKNLYPKGLRSWLHQRGSLFLYVS